jgi:hypothetical protein
MQIYEIFNLNKELVNPPKSKILDLDFGKLYISFFSNIDDKIQ